MEATSGDGVGGEGELPPFATDAGAVSDAGALVQQLVSAIDMMTHEAGAAVVRASRWAELLQREHVSERADRGFSIILAACEDARLSLKLGYVIATSTLQDVEGGTSSGNVGLTVGGHPVEEVCRLVKGEVDRATESIEGERSIDIETNFNSSGALDTRLVAVDPDLLKVCIRLCIRPLAFDYRCRRISIRRVSSRRYLALQIACHSQAGEPCNVMTRRYGYDESIVERLLAMMGAHLEEADSSSLGRQGYCISLPFAKAAFGLSERLDDPSSGV